MLIIRLLSRLPMPVLYIISDCLFVLAYYVVGYRRKVVMANLINSFPEKTKKELNKIALDFYKHLADFTVEVLKSVSISSEALQKRVNFTNTEVLQNYYDSGKSTLLLSAHQFNWEWGLLAGFLQPYPVDVVYQKLSNDKSDKLMRETRSKFGASLIKKGDAIREIIRKTREKRLIVINGDQTPSGGVKSDIHWATFLNQDTPFFKGPGVIPVKTNIPVVFFKISSPKRGYYDVEFIKLAEPPYEKGTLEVLERYIAETEKQIRERPAYWLWSHKRWKKKREPKLVNENKK
ncbi:MAG: lysophospholipid acyltransferase family protein [Bacteroidota bacterium]